MRNNLDCLLAILQFNVEHNILFFRITSDLIPFASHPICDFDWPAYFKQDFKSIGNYITAHDIRISMHPGQYTILNSPDEGVLEASVKELEYHAQVLDAMDLDQSAKIQLHVGGVYDNKEESIRRFIKRYHGLQNSIKRRLVIENDDHKYTALDCLRIHTETQVPVIFDSMHHELNNRGETMTEVFESLVLAWKQEDGIPMVDYSNSGNYLQRAKHAESIDIQQFAQFIALTKPFDCDIMLEIKDKEKSALKALEIVGSDERFNKPPE